MTRVLSADPGLSSSYFGLATVMHLPIDWDMTLEERHGAGSTKARLTTNSLISHGLVDRCALFCHHPFPHWNFQCSTLCTEPLIFLIETATSLVVNSMYILDLLFRKDFQTSFVVSDFGFVLLLSQFGHDNRHGSMGSAWQCSNRKVIKTTKVIFPWFV